MLEVNIKNNQLVKAGERLFSIDPGTYDVAVQSAEAVLQSTQQSLDAGVANIEAAKANVESAKANVWKTEQDTTRMRRIREDDPGAISERRIQSSEASLQTAQARLSRGPWPHCNRHAAHWAQPMKTTRSCGRRSLH